MYMVSAEKYTILYGQTSRQLKKYAMVNVIGYRVWYLHYAGLPLSVCWSVHVFVYAIAIFVLTRSYSRSIRWCCMLWPVSYYINDLIHPLFLGLSPYQ